MKNDKIMNEIIGDIEVEPKTTKGKPFTRWFFITGFDEYGREQSERLEVGPFEQEVHSKYKYVVLGAFLPADFVTKIGEWFWK